MGLAGAMAKIGMASLLLAVAACAPQANRAGTESSLASARTDSSKAAGVAPAIVAAPGAGAVEGPTLKAVRARGRVMCGVIQDMPGFAARDVIGQWRGFDIDVCRAVAAAVTGDAGQVRIVRLPAEGPRYSLLQAGTVDLVARGGQTFKDDAGLGLNFAGVSYYDGPGFLAGRALRGKTVDDLAGVRVCVQAGTAATLNLNERFDKAPAARKPQFQVFDTAAEALEAYRTGRCQALSGDVSMLSAQRSQLRDADRHIIVADDTQLEPQGPVVRQDDSQWNDIVRSAVQAMVLAEELGVGARTVAAERNRPSRPEVERLLKGDGYGQMLLLRDDWAFQVIRQVGSYADVYDRNLGPETALKMERGRNALWSAKAPGLLNAPPMR